MSDDDESPSISMDGTINENSSEIQNFVRNLKNNLWAIRR